MMVNSISAHGLIALKRTGDFRTPAFPIASSNPAPSSGIHVATLGVAGTNRTVWYTEDIGLRQRGNGMDNGE
jgi:hypothetical protein